MIRLSDFILNYHFYKFCSSLYCSTNRWQKSSSVVWWRSLCVDDLHAFFYALSFSRLSLCQLPIHPQPQTTSQNSSLTFGNHFYFRHHQLCLLPNINNSVSPLALFTISWSFIQNPNTDLLEHWTPISSTVYHQHTITVLVQPKKSGQVTILFICHFQYWFFFGSNILSSIIRI